MTQSSVHTDRLNLLICGAARSGTSTLKSYLSEHPEVAFVGERDLYVDGDYVGYPFATPFYSRAQVGELPGTYPAISRRLSGRVRYIATKWPYFMVFPHVACNIRMHLPDAKLLFILRNPVDALYSLYWHLYDDEASTFESFVDRGMAEMERLWAPRNRAKWPEILSVSDTSFFDLERGFYFQQLSHYFNLFDASRILVLRFEDFVSEPARELSRTLEFLGLDSEFEFENVGRRMNTAGSYPSMQSNLRERLNAFYSASNEALFELLDWPAEPWR